jgi:hypothetical protein
MFRKSHEELVKQAVILVSVDIIVQRSVANHSKYNTTKNTDSSVLMTVCTRGTFEEMHRDLKLLCFSPLQKIKPDD